MERKNGNKNNLKRLFWIDLSQIQCGKIFQYSFFLFSLLCTHQLFSIVSKRQRPLKILFLTDKFPYAPRYYLNNQISGFCRMGHDVYIFATKVPPDFSYFEDLETYNLGARTFYNNLPMSHRNYDIVYAQFGARGKQAVQLMSKHKLRTKILATCFRGEDITQKLAVDESFYNELFEKADLLLPVCDHFKNILMRCGADEKKITVHHSGINLEKFPYKKRIRKDNQPIKIITVSRLHPQKGLEYAIKAVASLKNQGYKVQYTVIGAEIAGSSCEFEQSRLQELIRQLGMQDTIRLAGYILQTDIVNYLYDADIFLLPSVTVNNTQEGIPNAMMEAMATGLPVVGTYHGGIPELVIDGKSGFLVDERDVQGLAVALKTLIKNPDLCYKMGRYGRGIVEKEHNSALLNEKIINLFYQKINEKSL